MKKQDLITAITDRMTTENKSPATIESYVSVATQFFNFLSRHPETIDMDFTKRMEVYLTHRVKVDKISYSTQKVDYWALQYIGKNILKVDIGKVDSLRAKRHDYIPHILNQAQIELLFEHLPTEYKLIARLIYGTGLRIKVDCLRLRIKDIDFDNKKILVHDSKGGKDRLVPISNSLIIPLKEQIKAALKVWEYDREHKFNGVYMPGTLARKYKNASTSKDWFWLFPNQNLSQDKEGVTRRHHVYDWAVQNAFLVTRRKVGLPEYTTPHTLRHCFATHFMQALLDQRIPREMAEAKLIEYMGHVDPKTLKWYVHLAAPENPFIESPLDKLEKQK